MGKEQLKAKLMAWNKQVSYDKEQRGGDDQDTWNLAKKQDEELKEAESKDRLALEAQRKISYDQDELYYRILRVERMADKVKDYASQKDIKNIMSEINAINQQLNGIAISGLSVNAPSRPLKTTYVGLSRSPAS